MHYVIVVERDVLVATSLSTIASGSCYNCGDITFTQRVIHPSLVGTGKTWKNYARTIYRAGYAGVST